jgi:membrane protein implicated in regulation of membrane protease activity
MLGLKWVCISIATVIVLLVTWFATPAGFWGAVFIAAIVFIVAAWAMGRFLSHSTEEDDAELNAAIHGGGAT